jgi:copper resistance protein B
MKHIALAALVMVVSAVPGYAYEPAGTPDDWPMPMMGEMPYAMVLGDRIESRFADEAESYTWDVQGWYGGDRDRLWFKTEGEGEWGGSLDDAELQVLFGRLFAPFWTWQVGVRHDFRPRPDRSHIVLGLQGVAPYEFEIDSALFVSDHGDLSARVEAEYDLRITQRVILQPRLELNAALSDDRAIGLASGINSTQLGVRLRYEIRREFAPYVGISWEQLYAGTADLARDAGEPTSVTSIVLGFRAWF